MNKYALVAIPLFFCMPAQAEVFNVLCDARGGWGDVQLIYTVNTDNNMVTERRASSNNNEEATIYTSSGNRGGRNNVFTFIVDSINDTQIKLRYQRNGLDVSQTVLDRQTGQYYQDVTVMDVSGAASKSIRTGQCRRLKENAF